MVKFDIAIALLMHLGHHIAPQNTSRHHILFFNGMHPPTTLPSHFKGNFGYADDFVFVIALRINRHSLSFFAFDKPRLSKINARGKLADYHDVETFYDLRL